MHIFNPWQTLKTFNIHQTEFFLNTECLCLKKLELVFIYMLYLSCIKHFYKCSVFWWLWCRFLKLTNNWYVIICIRLYSESRHGLYVVYICKWTSAHALGVPVVWHLSLPLMNSFNKTKAALFSCRLCFLRAVPFISLIQEAYMGRNSSLGFIISCSSVVMKYTTHLILLVFCF